MGGERGLSKMAFGGVAKGDKPVVSGEETQDVVERNLVPDDLVLELLVRQLRCVLVRPRVARDLVAFGDHAL